MSCVDLYLIETVYPAKFFSIHCVNTSGLKLNFEKEISIQCFRRRPQHVSLRPLKLLIYKRKGRNPIISYRQHISRKAIHSYMHFYGKKYTYSKKNLEYFYEE